MKNYKLIIFDLDDTLFDYKKTEKIALTKTCETLGIKHINNLYFYYKKANDIARKEHSSLTPNNIQEFRNYRVLKFLSLINYNNINHIDFIELYLKYSTIGILIAGVLETLENLEGIIKVVATNGTNYPRYDKLMNSKIAKYFSAYYSAENLGVAKPDPEFFRKIIKQFNVSNDQVLNVGDDYLIDIQSTIELGIDSCWFNYRQKEFTIPQAVNVIVIERFNKLIDFIKIKKNEQEYLL